MSPSAKRAGSFPRANGDHFAGCSGRDGSAAGGDGDLWHGRVFGQQAAAQARNSNRARRAAQWQEQLRANLKAAQELLESGLVLSWGDERGLFVARAVYLKEAFRRKCSSIHFLSELKRDNGVLTAVDDQNGSMYLL
jgi:hypothetical protein